MNIAQFSKISGVPVSTLHYYDRLDLFSPAETNKQNNYREYTIDQLHELNRILLLKDSGIKLTVIKQLLGAQPETEKLIPILEGNISLLEQEIIDRKQRIQRIQTNLFLLKNGGIPAMNEIIIKTIEPLTVVSLRKTYKKDDPTQSFDDFCEGIWQTLEKVIEKHNISLTTPCMTRYFEGLFINQNSPTIDLEIIEPLTKPLQLAETGDVQIQTLATQKVASAIHHGPLTEIGGLFEKMDHWLAKNNYEVKGPIREIYHRVEQEAPTENPVPVTELQIPIAD